MIRLASEAGLHLTLESGELLNVIVQESCRPKMRDLILPVDYLKHTNS